jgi:DNA-binding transcriptional LysR family regulator
MDRLTSMSVFVRAAEAPSFAGAAKDLGLSPAMIGKHIRHLEAHLGARLINRTTRSKSLTELGEAYLGHCQRALEEIEAGDDLVAQTLSVPRGTLRVTSPVAFGSQRLAPAVVSFMKKYPDITVQLIMTERVIDLAQERFDVAVRAGVMPDSSLRTRGLAPYRFVACASAEYLAHFGVPREPQDLVGHYCMGLAIWARGGCWTFRGPDGECTVAVKSRFQTNSGFGMRRAALAGAGIALLPEVLVAEDLAEKRLTLVLPDYIPASLPMNVVWVASKKLTPKVRSFIDFLVETFGNK